MKFLIVFLLLVMIWLLIFKNTWNEVLGWFPEHSEIFPEYNDEYLGIYTQFPVKPIDKLLYLKYGIGFVETYGCDQHCSDSSKWVNVMFRNTRKSYSPHELIKVDLGHAGFPEWMRKYRPWWFKSEDEE